MDEAFDSGPNFGSGFGEVGSEQKQEVSNGGALRAEVDTSAPFVSVMEAVTRFGGIGFWKPHTHNPSQPSQTSIEEVFDAAKAEDHVSQLHNDPVTKERETLEILKEIEATKTKFEELKVKLQKEAEVNTHPSDDGNNNGDTAKVQVDEVELSNTEILKRVEEATEEVNHCTRVLEEALSQVEASRQKSTKFKNSCRSDSLFDINGKYPDCNVPTMSIGQILSRKLVLAEEHSEKSSIRWKVSLAQILSKASNGDKRGGGGEKGIPAKRMMFGFGGMSFLVAKPSAKKRKKQGK